MSSSAQVAARSLPLGCCLKLCMRSCRKQMLVLLVSMAPHGLRALTQPHPPLYICVQVRLQIYSADPLKAPSMIGAKRSRESDASGVQQSMVSIPKVGLCLSTNSKVCLAASEGQTSVTDVATGPCSVAQRELGVCLLAWGSQSLFGSHTTW